MDPRATPPDRRRAGPIALAAVLALITLAKLAIVLAGADYDGDAYAHAMAGRRMLENPGDVTVHWVWLPLLHALYSAATAAGGGLSTLRFVNVAVTSASPLLLFLFLRDHLRSRRDPTLPNTAAGASPPPSLSPDPSLDPSPDSSPVPWLAAALLAIDPLCVWTGVTGQTEALFQLFILSGCILCVARRFPLAGCLFAAAALTRYETWPLVPVLLWLAARERPRTFRAHLLWLLPSAAAAAWCLFHYRATGEPLQFLRHNREFVTGYFSGIGYPWGKQPILPLMAFAYVIAVPVWTMLGPVHLVGLAATARAFRELPRAFFVVGAALLAIVTLGYLRGAHLGLARHAVVIAPLFCALAAVGTTALADRLRRRFPALHPRYGRTFAAFAALAIVFATRTVPKTIELWSLTRTAFATQAEAARALRALARPREAIFCDDGKIEVLSELAPTRFIRWQIPDVAPMHVADRARIAGSALVVSTPARAAHLAGGHTLWEGAGLAIVRFDPP